MDPEKLLILAGKYGVLPLVTLWAVWRLDWFMQRVVESQDKISMLLQRLIELH